MPASADFDPTYAPVVGCALRIDWLFTERGVHHDGVHRTPVGWVLLGVHAVVRRPGALPFAA